MAEIKDFDAILAAERQGRGEGPSFRLLGTDWKCLLGIPAWKMAVYGEKETTTFMDAVRFLASLVVEDQREEFLEKIKDDSITVDILNEVTGWLMEQYAERPPSGAES